MNPRWSYLALSPFRQDAWSCPPPKVLECIPNDLHPVFAQFLIDQGLGPMWAEVIYQNHLDSAACEGIYQQLKPVQHEAARLYLSQKSAISKIDHTLSGAQTPYAIIKGADIRERLYGDNPYLRTCADIDVLISESDRRQTIDALAQQGFQLKPVSTVISHEISLYRDEVTIDLHWGILRPGRVSGQLGAAALANRSFDRGFAVPDDPTTLLILLIHPAYTKYSASDIASLVRLIDLDRFLRMTEVNWQWTVDALSAYGARTAAWTTLERLRLLVGHLVPTWVLESLKPGPLQLKYLNYWLKNDGEHIRSTPVSILRVALSLALQDRPRDAARALAVWAKEYALKERKLAQLLNGID